MIAGWDRSVVAWKERLNSGGAAMVIRDIPAVPTGSYVELYGTLTCYLVFLYDFPFRKIMCTPKNMYFSTYSRPPLFNDKREE